ncbi:hypothetical protein [Nocardia sp. NBC_01329]|uniref:hypothetical protein n=1 Tax=Nocardia sp. NBC_01329 TaxID=2903594 RepID=UPI002E124BD9|nr:hypothetical protein OG405_25290 [Nocardia sp. NBC_01329]
MIVEVERARSVPLFRTGLDTGRRARVRALAVGLAVSGALLGTGCDSVSGIPGDDPGSTPAQTVEDSVMSGERATPAGAPPSAPALPPVPADAPPVGAVPGVPVATPALQRFAADLRSGDMTVLQSSCWTIPPLTVQTMYADPDAVLSALAQPGAAADGTLTWTDGVTTVTADEHGVAAGYACGRVWAAGAEQVYDAADARHTVRRYLARSIGAPLDPADEEDLHPLVCAASPATWDPQASGAPVAAPLAQNPGTLNGITGFTDQQISSQPLTTGYMAVAVPVTNASGITANRTFLLEQGDDGYCIGDISS